MNYRKQNARFDAKTRENHPIFFLGGINIIFIVNNLIGKFLPNGSGSTAGTDVNSRFDWSLTRNVINNNIQQYKLISGV